ncbi:hypothetical protein GCM10007981_18410 [Thermocladium modestius]|uniref:Methyltransferase type 11 domain-containing protein n=1 Tax=Thermocladium modestius TaxID=62609 RepID=A0A830GW01_9CREN|nr:class I SAM-dependent methyltransferase [Thermocladium modestius]GGP22420.1 hypothetical protein GCM10007981_18410 [Thermocladium modestius]
MSSLATLARIAWAYSALISKALRGLHRIVEKQVPPGSSVLDVGCGPGILDSMLQSRGSRVVCIDVLPQMAELAFRRGVDVAVGSAEMIPTRRASFDAAITVLVMHQVKDRERAVGEILSSLKPGGRWIAAEFARRSAVNRVFMDYGPFKSPGKPVAKWWFGVEVTVSSQGNALTSSN